MFFQTCANRSTEFTDHIVIWSAIGAVLFATTTIGNVLTMCAIRLSRKLSGHLSNRFVFSLAVSDVMVGVVLPYSMAFSPGKLTDSRKTCVLRFGFIIFACSVSIYHILAIAIDRYVAIVHPLLYRTYMSERTTNAVIVLGWCGVFAYSTAVVFWNNYSDDGECSLNTLYMTYVLTPMFIFVWLVVSVLYIKIWLEANKHVKRVRRVANCQNGNILSRDWKSVKVVMLILCCFSICWLPYFVTVMYIHILGDMPRMVYEICFTLAMTNSSMNPLIYAWKNSNFRKAFWCILRCKSPNSAAELPDFITNHEPTTVDGCLERRRCSGFEEDGTVCSQLTIKTDCEMNGRKGSDCYIGDVAVGTY